MIGRKSYHDMILETAGLLSYWNFGAGTGNKVWDQKGILHGDITGATWVQKANGLWALSFDGTNDKIAATGVTVTNYSVECWYKPDVITGTKTIIEQGNFILRQVTTGIEYGFITNEFWEVTNTVSGILTAGTWYFITLTKEGSAVKLYLNSVLVGSFTDATTQGNALGLTMAVSDRTNFPMLALTPANLTAKKGISITRQDNLQYTRGSLQGGDGAGAVYENFDPNQGTLEFWVRPNWNGNDGNNHILTLAGTSISNFEIGLYYVASNNNLYFQTKTGTHEIRHSVSNWTAGTWYHIVIVWDANNAVSGTYLGDLYINGTNNYNGSANIYAAITDGVDDWTPAAPASILMGSDSGSNSFNGIITGGILNRPLTSTEVSTNYASGAGHTDTFTVTPDTVWLGTYSDSNTDAVFQHRGQQVSSISTVTITTSQAVGLRSWKNGDRVVVYDDATTPNVVQTTINGTPSGSTIVVTDSCAAVTGTNKWISKNLIVDPNMEHANANAYTAGDAATTLAKDTTTVKFDTRSLKITNGDATQAFARQIITTAAGEDYRFHGWFYAPTTINGASRLVDVDLNAALSITATQAGIVAGWNEVDFCFEAADASTTIDLGSGSITNAQIGYWDNVEVGPNLVNNGGMGGTYAAGLAPGWTKDAGVTVAESATSHSGSKAQEITSTTVTGNGVFQNANVTSGKYYTISIWVRNKTLGESVTVRLETNLGVYTKTVSGETYTKMSITGKAVSSSTTTRVAQHGAGDINKGIIFDDISLIELDQNDPTTTGVTSRTTEYCDGDLKEVAVFNAVLSETEIQKQYQVGLWEGLAA